MSNKTTKKHSTAKHKHDQRQERQTDNGLGSKGKKALREALQANTALTELDISLLLLCGTSP